jgi:hypothetical protein
MCFLMEYMAEVLKPASDMLLFNWELYHDLGPSVDKSICPKSAVIGDCWVCSGHVSPG